jgi:hypothetical protein
MLDDRSDVENGEDDGVVLNDDRRDSVQLRRIDPTDVTDLIRPSPMRTTEPSGRSCQPLLVIEEVSARLWEDERLAQTGRRGWSSCIRHDVRSQTRQRSHLSPFRSTQSSQPLD